MSITYITYDQLARDVSVLRTKLPKDIGAISGVPRSGCIVAAMLAAEMRLPMHFPALGAVGGQRVMGTTRQSAMPARNILLVDDSVNTGDSMTAWRGWVSPKYTAAVYAMNDKAQVDYVCRIVPKPRYFQWNLFDHWDMTTTMIDLDGILCPDPVTDEVTDREGYARELMTLPLLRCPKRPVLGICTARLKRYRRLTEAWLLRHGVGYGQLTMHPARLAEMRRKLNNHAELKGRRYAAKRNATLFIESSARQAKKIFEIANKPVLCWPAGPLYQ